MSIIGRFLEHSRIYYFGNGGKPLVYLGSADWMQRNFDRRVEVVFPVEDEALKTRVTDEILPAFLQRQRQGPRQLRADGTYERRQPAEGRADAAGAVDVPADRAQGAERERGARRAAGGVLDEVSGAGRLPVCGECCFGGHCVSPLCRKIPARSVSNACKASSATWPTR